MITEQRIAFNDYRKVIRKIKHNDCPKVRDAHLHVAIFNFYQWRCTGHCNILVSLSL